MEEGTDDQADDHPAEQIATQLVIFGPAGKEKIEDGHGHIGEPQKIGDDKICVKGDQIIPGHMHHMITPGHRLFQIGEPYQIDQAKA